MTTTVVNIRDGFPAGGVYIGRAGRGLDGYFGNPFRVGADGNREEVLVKFETYFTGRMRRDPAFRDRVQSLAGKTLVCFCKPLGCHGDVVVGWLDRE